MNLKSDLPRLGILVCFAVTAAASDSVPTLKLGDPAPALEVAKWVKGDPINLKSGRVNVVEFWATWCGPCKASLPHLSALAAKYRGQVDVTGIAVYENGKDPLGDVERFVARSSAIMTFNAAYDDAKDRPVAKAWLEAAGIKGIPASIIVDRGGRVAWIGGPMEGLEEALDLAIQDKLDPAAAAKVDRDFKAGAANAKTLTRRILREARAGHLEAFAKLVKAKAHAMSSEADEIIGSSYRALATAHPGLAADYAEQVLQEYRNSAEVLTAVAREIVGESRAPGKPRGIPTALKFLARANELQEADPEFNALYARAFFLGGQREKAVELQKEVIRGMEAVLAEVDTLKKTPKEKAMIRKFIAQGITMAEKTLKQYQASAKPR